MRIFLLVLLTATAHAQTLAGYVEDGATGERLPGATVYVPAYGSGTTTNAYGFFSLTVPDDTVAVSVRYLGYEPYEGSATSADGLVTFRLAPASTDLGAVTVEAPLTFATAPGTVRLSAADVERVPALLGEADPLKAVQLAPSVRVGSEGSAGVHVRGGSPDQTLLLLDGAPVYNATHLVGAVSVFNTDALRSVTLVPGAPPARYGDRLSAVVDVTTRDGNRERTGGTATVGLLASRGLVEGPIAGGRGAFLVSARRTYADLLARPLLFEDSVSAGYAFQDGIARVSLDPDDRTRLAASVYGGRDRFYSRLGETFNFRSSQRTEMSRTGVGWGNVTASLQAARAVGERAFVSALATYSQYGFEAEREASETFLDPAVGTDQATTFVQESGLHDLAVRVDAQAPVGRRHALEAGASLAHRSFRPGHTLRSRTTGTNVVTDVQADSVDTVGGALYVSDAVRLGTGAAVEVGARLGWLQVRGRTFAGVQPRVAVTVDRGPWTVDASAGRTWQPLHLLSNPGVGLPTDLWVPATDRVPPSAAWQGALGASRTVGDGRVSLALFGKRMSGLVEYRDGAGFFSSQSGWEDAVVTGTGWAAGLEVSATVTRGATDVDLAYSLSRSRRAFDEIDGGRSFPYRYDRTHDLSLTVTRRLSERRRLTVLFVYATGAAVTLPVATYGFNEPVYSDRNGRRFPAYHRLDVAYEVRYGTGRLALGVYNVYNRLNPYYMELDTRFDLATESEQTGFRQVSLFPILPSVSYRFSF